MSCKCVKKLEIRVVQEDMLPTPVVRHYGHTGTSVWSYCEKMGASYVAALLSVTAGGARVPRVIQ